MPQPTISINSKDLRPLPPNTTATDPSHSQSEGQGVNPNESNNNDVLVIDLCKTDSPTVSLSHQTRLLPIPTLHNPNAREVTQMNKWGKVAESGGKRRKEGKRGEKRVKEGKRG